MYNKDTLKKRLYKILEMPVNADTIKSIKFLVVIISSNSIIFSYKLK